MRMTDNRKARLLASAAGLAMLMSVLAGCKTIQDGDATGSVSASPVRSEQEWRREAETWGARYRAHQGDARAAIEYAHALRMIGQRAQAAAVLEQTSIRDPRNKEVLGAYGRALADVGRFQQAIDVLNRAHTPEQPDWRILSAQGAVLDQMGRHQEAQRYYASALRIRPNDPSVLSNLALSYALSKDLVRAEGTLRQAAESKPVDPRVRQNLALVVGLQGRFSEAEAIAGADLPAAEAAANIAYLRQMLAEQKSKPANRPAPRRDRRGNPGAISAKPAKGTQG
jgi:Flp pilus assembly protein TadD